MKTDIYLYGMVLATTSYLLRWEYPVADSYGEISTKYRLPGGETGTSATVLSSMGTQVKMDGNHMGYNVYPLIKDFYSDKSVDISPLYFDESYDGLEDYVIIDKNTRTCFGSFCGYFEAPIKRWNTPQKQDIMSAEVAGIDPFFGEQSDIAAKLCMECGKPYVTIDCKHDSFLHKNSAINAVSGEYCRNNYADMDREDVLKMYIENSDGLTIITNGSKEFIYGRKSTGIKRCMPFKIDTVSTLGAGDTFKAGCTYALLKGMSDDEAVVFASACAAVACSRFPLPLNPPKLDEVLAMIATRK